MYDTQKKEEFINNVNIVSTGVKTYYHGGNDYAAVDLDKVKKAGHIPANVKTTATVGYAMSAADGAVLAAAQGITTARAFKLDINALPYDLCVLSGQEPLNDILGVYGSTTDSTILVENLPFRNASQLGAFETFCDANDGVGTMSFIFK